MRATSLLVAATVAMVAGTLVPLAGRQAPGATAAPAPGQQPQPAAAAPAQPENPRPNQPNFIGWERPSPNMSIPAGFTPLFNGHNLEGWHVSPTNHHGTSPDFHVAHGVIFGTQRPFGGGGILLTDRKFRDFELYLEVKPDWGCDSGIFLRSTEWGAAYQVTMDYLPGGSMGNVIGEGGLQGVGGRGRGAGRQGAAAAGGAARGGAAPAAGARAGGAPAAGAPAAGGARAGGAAAGRGGAPAIVPGIPLGGTEAQGTSAWHKVWKREDWNSVRVRMTGEVPHVTVWINDTLITDFTDTENHAMGGMVEGPIAIQVHGAGRWVPGGVWRWRTIAVKEL